MKITEDDIKQAIKDKEFFGRHCVFIPIDEQCGYKFYLEEYLRDNSYENQSIAAKHGLGPEVYEKINVGKYWGFVTERVSMAFEYWPRNEEIWGILDELQDIGIPVNDDYYKNFGIKNGEIIYIDFCSEENDSWKLSSSV